MGNLINKSALLHVSGTTILNSYTILSSTLNVSGINSSLNVSGSTILKIITTIHNSFNVSGATNLNNITSVNS